MDYLNLLVSRFIELIGLAKVAAVVALGWNFTVRLLQCLKHVTWRWIWKSMLYDVEYNMLNMSASAKGHMQWQSENIGPLYLAMVSLKRTGGEGTANSRGTQAVICLAFGQSNLKMKGRIAVAQSMSWYQDFIWTSCNLNTYITCYIRCYIKHNPVLYNLWVLCYIASSYHGGMAELHVRVLTSFIKLIKLLQNLMKLLPNHIMVW